MPTLQQRHKWLRKKRNLAVNDLCSRWLEGAEMPLAVRPGNESVPRRRFARAHRRGENEKFKACSFFDKTVPL